MSEKIHSEIIWAWSPDEAASFPPDRFHHFPETGSTNDDLLAMARAGEARPYEVIAADFQSRGRGRRGDRWEAPAGSNLLFSLALPLVGDRALWPRLPHLTAKLVGSAVEDVLGPGQKLASKWPNDLLHEGRKLAGILVEIVLTPTPVAVVGVGLNVNLRHDELPPDLRPIATSLYELIGCESSRWFLLGLILRGFLREYPARIGDFKPVLDWIRPRDFLVGQSLSLRVGRDRIEGLASGIGDGGELIVETGGGELVKVVSAEEILRR